MDHQQTRKCRVAQEEIHNVIDIKNSEYFLNNFISYKKNSLFVLINYFAAWAVLTFLKSR